MGGNVLDAGERLVDCEHVGDVLRSLRLELVEAEAALAGEADAATAVVTAAGLAAPPRFLAYSVHLPHVRDGLHVESLAARGCGGGARLGLSIERNVRNADRPAGAHCRGTFQQSANMGSDPFSFHS